MASPLKRICFTIVLALGILVPPSWALNGGEGVDADDFPWMVALLDRQGSTPGSGYFCGGVLIHPSWVMTAAHCVADRTTRGFEVALGLDQLSDDAMPQRVQVAEMFFHPRYLFRNGQHDGDIALLRLARPVMDRESLRIFERDVVPKEDNVFTLGWSHSRTERALTTLPMTVLARGEASQATGEGFLLDAVPVYAGAETLGLCYGDSGTPLVVRENGEPRLLGVASYVVGGCTGYAVFGNLQFYRDWIVSHVFPGFDEWRQANQIDALWNDEDGDGVSNYGEFARVSDPRHPAPLNFAIEPVLRANERPAVRFPHHMDAAFRVEHSQDLMLWESLPASQIVEKVAIEENPRAERVTVESSLGLAEHRQQFLRILSDPHAVLTRPSRSAFREFYLKGDAALLRQNGQFEQRYHVTDLIEGTTTFKFFTPSFSPRFRLIDRDTGELLLDAGTEGAHTLVSQAATQAGKAYELVLSSVNPTDTGTFTFHYPQLLENPQNLEVGRQAIQGVLDDLSNFDGNFYSRAYQIFGAVPGHTVTITLRSDPEFGGFRPHLVILNEQLEIVVETEGEPETETSVTFTLESAQKYFAFATTVNPGDQGLFTLSGRRVQ